MRDRLPTISPRSYARVTLVALAALTLIVLTGAAVRLTGSGLGLPGLAEVLRRRSRRRSRHTRGSSTATA